MVVFISSEDELEILLHGTLQQKRKLTRSISRGSLEMSESSEDEFDKEMDKELDETMGQHEQQQFTSAGGYRSSYSVLPLSGLEFGVKIHKTTGLVAQNVYWTRILFYKTLIKMRKKLPDTVKHAFSYLDKR